MMFIYTMTKLNFRMSLRKYHDMTIAINDAAPYTSCLESHKNLISTSIPLKFSQINRKIMHIHEIENNDFVQNYPKDPFFRDAAHMCTVALTFETLPLVKN